MKTWNRWQCAFLSYNHCFHESFCDLNACRSNVFIFNWKIIALQSCIGFCHVSTWISHRYMCVFSLLNLPPTSHPIPPLYIFTQHQIWAPVSYSKFPWLSNFTYCIVYVSMLLSQSMPLFSSPTGPTSLFSMSASPVLSCR